MITPLPKFPPIFIADDNSDDRFLLEHRLRKAGVVNPIIKFHDGEDLVAFMENAGDAGWPACLILLDLKMPRLDGFDVLAWLHARVRFRDLPVMVITSSSHPSDRQRAIESGATEYLEKFPTEADLARVVQWATSQRCAS
jgi:two-component system, response regulator